MNSRKRKQRVHQLFLARLHNPAFLWHPTEDRDWDSIVPVGREFGSPDYEILMQQDVEKFRINLTALVARGQSAENGKGESEESDEYSDTLNVQAALRELGYEVTVPVAASVWRSYSSSIRAGWMSGAETVSKAKHALFYYCSSQRRHVT